MEKSVFIMMIVLAGAGVLLNVYLAATIYLGNNARNRKSNALSVRSNNSSFEKERMMDHYDDQTNLPSRTIFSEKFGSLLDGPEQGGRDFAVLIIDIDRLKHINDFLVHDIRDCLIWAAADRLQLRMGQHNLTVSWSEDEFAVLLHNIADTEEVEQYARALLQLFETPFVIHGREIIATVSIGIAISPADGQDELTLINKAESARDEAKLKGGNQYWFYQVQHREDQLHRLQLENDLRKALANNQFQLVYQPQIDAITEKIVGAEVLLRWCHPKFGMIPPDTFIPLAEVTGLIHSIGEWVLRKSCEQMQKWRPWLTSALRLSVNISVKQLMKDNILDRISQILQETAMNPEALELEITESIFIDHSETILSKLDQIAWMGIGIAVDDFGKGQTSLSYFKYLPIRTLKIDRMFIQELTSSKCDQAIVSSLIILAHSLGVKVVAEGVEHMEEFDLLTSYQCDEVQGYLFSRPLPANDFEDLLVAESLYNCEEPQPSLIAHPIDWNREKSHALL